MKCEVCEGCGTTPYALIITEDGGVVWAKQPCIRCGGEGLQSNWYWVGGMVAAFILVMFIILSLAYLAAWFYD